jgi:phage N-6-adenine-methyltransferase
MNAPLDIDALIGTPIGGTAKGGTGFGHEKPHDGKTVEWYTPPSVFEELGLEFDLDPCAPAGGLPWIPAKKFYSLPDNGLDLPWPERGLIWCNPPYGPKTKKWLRRMGEHRRGVALVFARTDTEWFHETAETADGILFLNGRIKFVDETGEPPLDKNGRSSTAGAGSMLVAWGEEAVEALRRMEWNAGGQHTGLFVPLNPLPAYEDIIG